MNRPVTRRERNAEATRRDILQAGYAVFSEQPYSDVSGLQICTRAGVTRGALQHHFGSKLGLFMAVFEKLQHDVTVCVADAIAAYEDPWEQARAGIAAFLEACTAPAYQAIVLKDGPAAIGWERWRELDTDYFADLVDGVIHTLAGHGLADHPPALLAAVVRGTLTELSFEITRSDDHRRAVNEAMAVVQRLLDGFRVNGSQSVSYSAARDDKPRTRVGVGQLRASTARYLEQAAAGEHFEIVRRGLVAAELGPPTRPDDDSKSPIG
ncbi:MAG: TetR/AcrR family transcriptional regulator [Mycobacteriaceae bacterium]|nr:TetR/AcrR family transcriptional regulator [Mycobacteriaceae bacterium]MBV9638698.1 TetR/AcrR family transcriptional regulator [Mycobacteriaceae bacterium]